MAKMNFEKSLEKLEKIINKLENDDTALDEAVDIYKSAIELINACELDLKKASDELEKLEKGGIKDERV